MLKELHALQQQLAEVEANLSAPLAAAEKQQLIEKADALREQLQQVRLTMDLNRL